MCSKLYILKLEIFQFEWYINYIIWLFIDLYFLKLMQGIRLLEGQTFLD